MPVVVVIVAIRTIFKRGKQYHNQCIIVVFVVLTVFT